MKARAPARAEGRIGKPSSPEACSPPAPGQTNAQPRLFGHSPLCRSISAQTLCPAPQSLSGSGSTGPGLGSRLRVGLTLCWQIGSCPSHGPSITPTQSLWPPPRLQTHLAPSRFRREGSFFKTQDSGGLSPARLGQGPSPQMLLSVPPFGLIPVGHLPHFPYCLHCPNTELSRAEPTSSHQCLHCTHGRLISVCSAKT